MKQNVCQACLAHSGGCCVDVRFSFHDSEAQPFVERQDQDSLPYLHKLIKESDGSYTYDSGGDLCMFLDEEYRCTIYDQRPLICRLYPVLWKKGVLAVDFTCPLSHLVPLREMLKWLESPANKKQINLMPELDFDLRARRYVNIITLREDNDVLEILDWENLTTE